MANDSLFLDIDARALQNIHGGMIPVPDGGGYAPLPPRPAPPPAPAGGSMTLPNGQILTCPSGSAPNFETTSFSGKAGLGPIKVPVHYNHTSLTCEKIK